MHHKITQNAVKIINYLIEIGFMLGISVLCFLSSHAFFLLFGNRTTTSSRQRVQP